LPESVEKNHSGSGGASDRRGNPSIYWVYVEKLVERTEGTV
jgi:hypothetical protein